jgi:hypothetical protein
VTRNEVLAWLDGHVGDSFLARTALSADPAAATLFSASGDLQKAADGGVNLVGGSTLDVSKLDDTQVEGAKPYGGPRETLVIPLAENVTFSLRDNFIESG